MLKEISILNAEDLENLRHYAELKYSLTSIATLLMVDVAQLRIALLNPMSDVAIAYNSGKLASQITRREAILKAANNGQEWAIKILDSYEVEQIEDELMP